ncbi:MAG: RNA polymerase sigma factor [Cyclobacteriaceae bacterium]|nr:RNA polymerase sigma factor [Cyclobacteriaceae bacterium]
MCDETLSDNVMIHSEKLIDKARVGEEKAISTLVGLWYKRIYNLAYKYFLDHDLAMDVTQKTFISMYGNIEGLKEAGRFKAWLYRIAMNHCHDEDRRSKRSLTISFSRNLDESENYEKVKSTEAHPDIKLDQTELSDMMRDALRILSAEQREVLVMKEYEGLKFREIAEVLDISENTVKSRLYYALSNMKKILKAKNITKETVYYER